MTSTIKYTSLDSSAALDRAVLGLIGLAWGAVLATILAHPIFVTNDSISDYTHIWYIAKVFWAGDGIPYRFPLIGHGDALAFPYGFVPWFTAALLRPIFGDWVTTLWLVVGGVGTFLATVWAFPELRRPLPMALLLVNPVMVEGVILGQLPFLWGSALWFVAVGLWRRDRLILAILAAAAAQATHPAVVLPLAGLMVLAWLRWEPRRRRLLLAYAVSVLLTLPAIAMVFLSPVVDESSLHVLIANFLGTAGLRAVVFFAPFAVTWLDRRLDRQHLLEAVVAVAVLNILVLPIRHTAGAWGGLLRTPDQALVPFLESASFHPGQTYRYLRVGDDKMGMYQLVQHGAVLDSELFPESMDRRSWPSASAYRAFLDSRHVNDVLIYSSYDDTYHTNEHELLDQLVAQRCGVRVLNGPEFDLYQVGKTCE